MVPGTTVRVGDRDYVVPDATLETAEALAVKLEEVSKGGIHSITAVAEVFAIAVKENYPDVTAAEVKKVIRLPDANRIMREVLAAVGLRSGEGEATSP